MIASHGKTAPVFRARQAVVAGPGIEIADTRLRFAYSDAAASADASGKVTDSRLRGAQVVGARVAVVGRHGFPIAARFRLAEVFGTEVLIAAVFRRLDAVPGRVVARVVEARRGGLGNAILRQVGDSGLRIARIDCAEVAIVAGERNVGTLAGLGVTGVLSARVQIVTQRGIDTLSGLRNALIAGANVTIVTFFGPGHALPVLVLGVVRAKITVGALHWCGEAPGFPVARVNRLIIIIVAIDRRVFAPPLPVVPVICAGVTVIAVRVGLAADFLVDAHPGPYLAVVHGAVAIVVAVLGLMHAADQRIAGVDGTQAVIGAVPGSVHTL